MTIIINPGSGGIPAAGKGWTNTYEGALAGARDWLRRMTDDGIRDVELVDPGVPDGRGRWTFGFRHTVTGVVVELTTHGLSDWRACERERIFLPKVYWNGSSCGGPEAEDWIAPGFEVVKTLRAVVAP